ncbi:ATP-binding protein [uncultured Cocleimonas sp.]|uniref:ATP-binding protein n=1 Tax=uncultured Cocleimonas sp. TaxID=1051587 RepID=UPI0026346C14|nr:AAA family ATPase [uncultured Cocleimonas sp.]
MLIKSLVATNFRKYHKLEVTDIPESGVITVAGSNESGKTSIGESICFALFGRTFFLDEKNLGKLVSWGSDVSDVTINFISGDDDIYELTRSVDRKGVSKATLQKITGDDEGNNKIDGVDEVAKALPKILGFDYDAFANSFYLAQRELTSPDPQSSTIKQMAGIGAYAQITDDFEKSNIQNEEAIKELMPQVESTQADLDEIQLDETWLPELIDAEETLGTEQRDRERLVGHLNDNGELYSNNYDAFHSARKAFGTFSFLGKLLFPITVILWILWVLNTYFKDSSMESLSTLSTSMSEEKISTYASMADNWLLPAAIITLIGYLITLVVRKNSQATMVRLDEEAEGFSGSLQHGHRYVTTLVETLLPERVVQMLHERKEAPSTLQILPPREQFNNLSQLAEGTTGYKADTEEITAAVTRLTDSLKKQDGEIEDLGRELLGDISKEKERSDKAGNLRSTLQSLNKVVDKCKYSIETQNISIGLMQRAAKDSVELFNQNISDISANTLPKFTEGRYSEVRIAEDFSVQIYSGEKTDYMDFDEISSGTQRQVMLALRMAMSEELAKNSGNEKQFIFLDEPFAFFDQLRTNATMRALPDVSNVINQVWISAQEFPADVQVAKAIICPLDGTELIV